MPDLDAAFIPVVEEAVVVDKVVVTTDAVRVHTVIKEREMLVEETLDRDVLTVRRVAVDRPVDVAPPPRAEGDTTVISLVEERLVIEKRLFVIEEIHVTREQTQQRVAIPVTLRATRASIERPAVSDGTDTISTGSDIDGRS